MTKQTTPASRHLGRTVEFTDKYGVQRTGVVKEVSSRYGGSMTLTLDDGSEGVIGFPFRGSARFTDTGERY